MSRDYNLVFLCGARDFHAMDWYRSAEEVVPKERLSILTDLIAGEGFKKIITEKDDVKRLLILDKFLFRGQSKLGNLWRNILKFLVLPFQVFLLKRFSKNNPNSIFYAHSMYYLWLAHYAKVDFIGTPQGSDILIKPFKSKIFKNISRKALKSAKFVTVDSQKMKEKMIEISGVVPYIVQNGIDIKSIEDFLSVSKTVKRDKILSIRGFTPLYRIKKIVESRNNSSNQNKSPLTFIYPFHSNEYKSEVLNLIDNQIDVELGRVNRDVMYSLIHKSSLVISVPLSDSSPRSVYESIFCGAVVAITYNTYYDSLPNCMKERIIIVDINNKYWFNSALEEANSILNSKFVPSKEALEVFDQRRCFISILKLINKI